MPNILITGANRGIGLELARSYAGDGWSVHATARDLDGATELKAVSGDVHLYALDVKDRAAIKALAGEIAGPLDVVIANAGVGGKKRDGGMQVFGDLDYDAFADTLAVNTLGAVATAEAFAPHLKEGAQKKLACVSSLMGSIADTSGGAVAYRASKAALNMAMQASAAGLAADGIATIVFHPGWVQTDMGGAQAPTSVEDSVAGMRRVLAGVKVSDKAQFLDFTGKQLPW